MQVQLQPKSMCMHMIGRTCSHAKSPTSCPAHWHLQSLLAAWRLLADSEPCRPHAEAWEYVKARTIIPCLHPAAHLASILEGLYLGMHADQVLAAICLPPGDIVDLLLCLHPHHWRKVRLCYVTGSMHLSAAQVQCVCRACISVQLGAMVVMPWPHQRQLSYDCLA